MILLSIIRLLISKVIVISLIVILITRFLVIVKLGDSCIQNLHLGSYIIGYMVRNFVLQRHVSGAVNVISDHITDDIPPQMNILNMVSPIIMHFLTFIRQRHSILHHQTEASSAT